MRLFKHDEKLSGIVLTKEETANLAMHLITYLSDVNMPNNSASVFSAYCTDENNNNFRFSIIMKDSNG